MKTKSIITVAGYVLVNPVTGLYFNGTNFSAKAEGAKMLTERPNEAFLKTVWPGAEIRIMTTSGNIFREGSAGYFHVVIETEEIGRVHRHEWATNPEEARESARTWAERNQFLTVKDVRVETAA